MRVLHFIPDIGVSNGVMSFILNYAAAMPDGIIFDVVYFHETEKTRRADIEALGGRVYKIERPSPVDLISKKPDALFNEHKGEWDALHIHAPHFAVFIAPAAKRAGIKKICVHCHTTEYSLKGSSLRNELLSLYAKYFIKDKFACSDNAAKLWYGNTDYRIMRNAVDLSKYEFNPKARERVRAELALGNALTVGHIGKTDIPQKNHPFILKAFSELVKAEPDSRLLLIGAEPTENLDALSDELGISEKVIYLGIRSDIPELLQALDVFLFPSTGEGLPVSLIEAQAASLPVLMSDVITDEVRVTDFVCALPLSAPLQEWAQKLTELSEKERKPVTLTDWDIRKHTAELADYYRK
ncbi:MAG: glycosyltransferase [Eubacterium sp.]|nr:glycosyltransferase [Eubacterium sp.]